MKKLSFFPLIIVFLVSGNVSAFDHEITHRQLTEKAIENSLANQYLIDNLNLSDGTATLINGVKIEKWLIEGSYLEDEPNCRASNHFHNPLKPWTDSYMSDQPWFINWWCSDGEYPAQNIKSNIHWATGYTEPAPDGTKAETNNQWDWDHAREYFYIYLTDRDFQENEVAGTEDIKKTYFVNCFQALGQVLHLIQDMAVPAHVRDDFKSHLDFQGITPANLFKPKKWFRDKIEYYVEHHIKELLMGSVGGELTEPSLTKFWDTNDYIGQDPDDLNNLMIGLAEYTNMNFASKNTIFAEDFLSDSNTSNDDYYHPYPRKTSTDVQDYINRNKLPETVIGEDNIPDIRFHIKKTGDGEEIAYFAAPTYLTRDIQNEPDYDERVFNRSFKIDDKCAKNYAELLLPRAVGYSAGLLDYFFRGSLEVPTCVPFIYDNKIVSLNFKAKNVTATQETMSEGNFTVVVRYTPVGGNPDGSEDQFFRAQDVYCNELQYEDELEFTVDLPLPASQDNISFDVYESLKCYLVFKGTLGVEEGAVIGKVFTLGEIKFREDWDNGLNGNHDWAHGQSPTEPVEGGETINNITTANNQDTLIKENIRYAGVEDGRTNQSALSLGGGNEILITPNTFLHFKIDNISVSPPSTIYLQALRIQFANGTWLQFCPDGQCDYPIDINWPPMDININIDSENALVTVNIHQLFQEAGIAIPEYLYLSYMNFIQLFEEGAGPATTQRMEIDFIRIVEETP